MSNVDCTCGLGDGSGFSLCSKCYPSRTVRGMYQQEQQIAKAEDAGLIVTASDLADAHPICENCGERLDSEFSTCKPCNKRYLCK